MLNSVPTLLQHQPGLPGHRETVYKAHMTIKDAYHRAMHAKVYEPEKRNKDGWRWISHRFPIKGGISALEVFHRELTKPNTLFARLTRPTHHR